MCILYIFRYMHSIIVVIIQDKKNYYLIQYIIIVIQVTTLDIDTRCFSYLCASVAGVWTLSLSTECPRSTVLC